MVVVCAGVFVVQVYSVMEPFLYFWILNPGWVKLLDKTVAFLIMLGLLWASVRQVRDTVGWKDIARFAWIPLILILLSAFGSDDFELGFRNKPKYHSHIAPGMMPLTDPLPLDTFLEQGGKQFSKFEE